MICTSITCAFMAYFALFLQFSKMCSELMYFYLENYNTYFIKIFIIIIIIIQLVKGFLFNFDWPSQAISQLQCASFSRWVLLQNLPYENEFDFHESWHFHMNGFTQRLKNMACWFTWIQRLKFNNIIQQCSLLQCFLRYIVEPLLIRHLVIVARTKTQSVIFLFKELL